MSKSDQKQAKQTAQSSMATNNANAAATNATLQPILSGAQDKANSLFPGITSSFSDISQTGGFDPSVTGQINQTYGDLATTGGISEADATAMRNRASEAARSTYDVGREAAARSSAATGGYGATGGAIQENLARRGSQAAATAAVDSDASIVGARQTGKIAGASGLERTQQDISGNKLAATTGLSNVYGMDLNQANKTVDQILQNYQQTGQLNNQDLTILTNLANQPGIFDKIVGTIGTLGGAAAGIIGAVKPKVK